jgi:integrase
VSAIAINLAALPADVQALVRQHAVALVSDPTKDQRYRATQLGSSVADFLGWLANDRGAAEATLDSYERVLARLAIAVDKQPGDVLTQELRDVRDAFTAGQRRKVTAIIRSFFRWLYEEERISDNPAGRLRAPRRDQRILDQNELYTDVEKAAIVTAQDDIMDRVGVLLLLRAGLRQAELRGLRVRDVNLVEKYVLVVRGKGRQAAACPDQGRTRQVARGAYADRRRGAEPAADAHRVPALSEAERPHAGSCSWPADVEAGRARMVVSLPTPRRSRRRGRLVGSEDARGTAHLCDRSRAGDGLEPRRCPEEPRPRVAADDRRHLHALRVRGSG